MKTETENYILRTYTIKLNSNSTEWIFIRFVLFIYFHISFFLPKPSWQLYTYPNSMLRFLWCRWRSVVKSTKTATKTMTTRMNVIFFTFKHHVYRLHLYTSNIHILRGYKRSNVKMVCIVSYRNGMEWNQITVAKVFVLHSPTTCVRACVCKYRLCIDCMMLNRCYYFYVQHFFVVFSSFSFSSFLCVTKRMQEHTNIIENTSIVWWKSIVLEIFWCYTRLNIERKFLTCN